MPPITVYLRLKIFANGNFHQSKSWCFARYTDCFKPYFKIVVVYTKAKNTLFQFEATNYLSCEIIFIDEYKSMNIYFKTLVAYSRWFRTAYSREYFKEIIIACEWNKICGQISKKKWDKRNGSPIAHFGAVNILGSAHSVPTPAYLNQVNNWSQ